MKSPDPRNFPTALSIPVWLLYLAFLGVASWSTGQAFKKDDQFGIFLGVICTIFWLGILWVARRSELYFENLKKGEDNGSTGSE